MNRSSRKSSSGSRTVFWWVGWIILTIASFFAAAAFWTPVIADRYGTIHQTRTAVLWVAAVFGTWMVFLIPLIIVMYHKVDKAYEDARIRRENAQLRYRSIYVEPGQRLLPEIMTQKLRAIPEAIEGGKLVTVILKNGARIPYVFITGSREILGIYNYTQMPFRVGEIAEIEPANLDQLPSFLPMNWLRLDGVALPE